GSGDLEAGVMTATEVVAGSAVIRRSESTTWSALVKSFLVFLYYYQMLLKLSSSQFSVWMVADKTEQAFLDAGGFAGCCFIRSITEVDPEWTGFISTAFFCSWRGW